MAERLRDFDWENAPSANRKQKYPWSEWLDGSVWHLRQGKDYKARTPGMRASALREAKKRDGMLRIATVPTGLVLQLVPDSGDGYDDPGDED